MRYGQNVELEPQPASALQPHTCQGRGQLAKAGEALYSGEFRLGARPEGIAPHEKQGVSLGGQQQVALLGRACQVEEVGGLHDQGGVDAGGGERGLDPGEARLELRERYGIIPPIAMAASLLARPRRAAATRTSGY